MVSLRVVFLSVVVVFFGLLSPCSGERPTAAGSDQILIFGADAGFVLAITEDGEMLILDRNAHEVARFAPDDLVPQWLALIDDKPTVAIFRNDGVERVFGGSRTYSEVEIWDVREEAKIASHRVEGTLFRLAFSKEMDVLASLYSSRGRGHVEIVDVRNDSVMYDIPVHGSIDLAFADSTLWVLTESQLRRFRINADRGVESLRDTEINPPIHPSMAFSHVSGGSKRMTVLSPTVDTVFGALSVIGDSSSYETLYSLLSGNGDEGDWWVRFLDPYKGAVGVYFGDVDTLYFVGLRGGGVCKTTLGTTGEQVYGPLFPVDTDLYVIRSHNLRTESQNIVIEAITCP